MYSGDLCKFVSTVKTTCLFDHEIVKLLSWLYMLAIISFSAPVESQQKKLEMAKYPAKSHASLYAHMVKTVTGVEGFKTMFHYW